MACEAPQADADVVVAVVPSRERGREGERSGEKSEMVREETRQRKVTVDDEWGSNRLIQARISMRVTTCTHGINK